MRKIYLLMIAGITAINSFGQAASKNDVEEILASTIQLLRNSQELPDQKITDKLKGNPELLKKHIDYTRSIRQLNDTFIKAFTDIWTFSRYDTTGSHFTSWGKNKPSGIAAYIDFYEYGEKDEKTGAWNDARFVYVNIAEFKNGKHKKSFGSMGIPISAGYIDFYHAIKFIQDHFEAVNKNAWKSLSCFPCIPDLFRPLALKEYKLTDYTLLVDRKYLSNELNEENFKNHYPYKFEVLDSKQILAAFHAKREGSVFLAPSFILESRATGKEIESYITWFVFHLITPDGKLVSYDLGTRVKKNKLDCLLNEDALKNMVKRD